MANSIFIVICGRKDPYVAERYLRDMGREETIRQLASGEWGNVHTGERFDVSSIVEVGTDKDVTDEFIKAAQMYLDHFSPIDRQAAAWDHARDLRKHESAQ